jgi:uncharacterized LabA/DUF88 family protein
VGRGYRLAHTQLQASPHVMPPRMQRGWPQGFAASGSLLVHKRLLTSNPEQRRPLYAILVDADNARHSAVGAILEELALLGGDSSVRRVYGDFSCEALKPWKDVSLAHSFRPVNAFSYVSGKDSTDAALMLDAMDLLYANSSITGFAIVSSDSDFTPLAQRLREAGKSVVGFGERKTPAPFVTACERFIYTENLLPVLPTTSSNSAKGQATKSTALVKKNNLDAKTLALLRRAIDDSARDDGWSYVGTVGKMLNSLQPDFDTRSYGYARIGALLRAHPQHFENTTPYPMFRCKVQSQMPRAGEKKQ